MGHQAQTRRILRMRDICQKLGLCPSTVHDLVARC
jgi:predicted DNA-binding transcriptional regulator AlpA